jgi:hypothetical protein
MMTQIDEVNKDRHFQMAFVEFLEAISRVAAEAKFPEPTKTVAESGAGSAHETPRDNTAGAAGTAESGGKRSELTRA